MRLLVAASLLLLGIGVADAAAAAPRPNIVVILCDDMGFSDLGCYGGEMHTPNLDRLAGGGLRFMQFYNTARCCPTRACLLTGLYPHQAAVGHMMEDRGLDGYQGDLSRHAMTMAQVLRTAGYGTYAVGKWHVTRHDADTASKHNWPLQRGFDRFYGTIRGGGSYFDPGSLTRDNTMISPFADPEYKPATFYYTDAISEHAVRFIGDHAKKKPSQPLFMYVAYTAAHWPMHALPEDIAKHRGQYDGGYEPIRRQRFERAKQLGLLQPEWELSPQVGDWNSVKNKAWEARCMEVYAAMIDRMDQGVGRIVAELERQGRLQNTLLLFLQDNGACQEEVGRRKRPLLVAAAKKKQSPIPLDAVRLDVIPTQDRQGTVTRMGPDVMPGPGDTYIAYGENWANVSNTPFRYYKHFVHEGGISTPLVAHWPQGISRRGQLERQPGHLIDIMATCVDLSGAKYPTEFAGNRITPLEGRSLVPAFGGKTLERDAIYWEHEGNRAIRQGKWKLVAKGPQGPWELYDIERDRTEMHDLAAANPDRVKSLAAQWETWARGASSIPWPWGPPYGEAQAKPKAASQKKPRRGDGK